MVPEMVALDHVLASKRGTTVAATEWLLIPVCEVSFGLVQPLALPPGGTDESAHVA